MNRFDEIQGAARDVADWVCADPADRNRMADDLIRLVTLIVAGVGKSVAVSGEENFSNDEDSGSFDRYVTGERIMDGAREMAEGAANAGCDLDRYERDGLKPAWTSTRKQSAPAVDGSVNGSQTDVQPLFAPGAEAYYRKVLGLDAPKPSAPTYGCRFDGDSWAPEHVYSGTTCVRCSAERCEGCGDPVDIGSHGQGNGYGGCV